MGPSHSIVSVSDTVCPFQSQSPFHTKPVHFPFLPQISFFRLSQPCSSNRLYCVCVLTTKRLCFRFLWTDHATGAFSPPPTPVHVLILVTETACFLLLPTSFTLLSCILSCVLVHDLATKRLCFLLQVEPQVTVTFSPLLMFLFMFAVAFTLLLLSFKFRFWPLNISVSFCC